MVKTQRMVKAGLPPPPWVECPAKTRRMVNADPSLRPPSLQRDKRPILAKLLFPVVPESDATAPLPSPNQLVPSKTRVSKNTRPIVNVSDLARLCLCCRIQKIYDMSTDVIEGYGTYYYVKYGKPLP